MKFCIYVGVMYTVADDSGKLLSLVGPFGNEMVLRDQVVELPEDIYRMLQAEYSDAVNNLMQIEQRIVRLNEEYYKKRNALQEMRTDAGRKEKEIISRALRQIDKT